MTNSDDGGCAGCLGCLIVTVVILACLVAIKYLWVALWS